jgi:lipoprotein-anchoring transpeptidase ErfK/SrfK
LILPDHFALFCQDFQMIKRPLAVSAGLFLGCVILAAPAAAQSYPPQYRTAPALEEDEALPPGYVIECDDPLPDPAAPTGRIPQRGEPDGAYDRQSRSYPADTEAYRAPSIVYPEQDRSPPPAPYSPGYGRQLGSGQPDPSEPALLRPPGEVGPSRGTVLSSLPPEDEPEVGEPKQLPPHLRRQLVDYRTKEPAGTTIIDTANTYLYLVLGDGKAMRYGIGVGREGFTWAGRERISRMAEWPDWHPPDEMVERQPYLPRFMAGGPGNPLGARALYLGNTLYRIHGTNQPSTIGQTVSSGCIRLLNDDIEDLYNRVRVGSRVVVLSGKPGPAAARSQALR